MVGEDTANFDVASGAHVMKRVSLGGSSAHDSTDGGQRRSVLTEGGRRGSALGLAHAGGQRGSAAALDVEGSQAEPVMLVEAVSAAQASRDHARVKI